MVDKVAAAFAKVEWDGSRNLFFISFFMSAVVLMVFGILGAIAFHNSLLARVQRQQKKRREDSDKEQSPTDKND